MALDHKILKLISMNEQDFAEAARWFRQADEDLKCHIWTCIQQMGLPEAEDEDATLQIISRFAQLGMAMVAEQAYRRDVS